MSGLSLALSMIVAAPVPTVGSPVVRILVARDGVVRVTDTMLRRAGFDIAPRDLPRLRLRNLGHQVPVLVERGRPPEPEGRFHFEFLGKVRRGEHRHVSRFGPANTYLLDLAPHGIPPARIAAARSAPTRETPLDRTESDTVAHAEMDLLHLPITGPAAPLETWFWAEVSTARPRAVPVAVSVDRIGSVREFGLRVGLVGYSSLPHTPDHRVAVFWNGHDVGTAVWDGAAAFVFEAVIAGQHLKEGENELRLQPRDPVGIDVSFLDWVEVAYSRRNLFGLDSQTSIALSGDGSAVIPDAGEGAVSFFDLEFPRVSLINAKSGRVRLSVADGPERGPGERRFQVVRPGGAYAPERIEVRRPVDLRAAGLGADFLIIAHPSLENAARRLAIAREREGLKTLVVSIEDVYDMFRDGSFDPGALRDFLTHARTRWSPRPSYVLLFGDASWDYRKAVKAPATSANLASGLDLRDHQLVPTEQWQSPYGAAPSDSSLAMREGEELPDLAIGRFPATSPEEAEALVDKTLDFGRHGAALLGEGQVMSDDFAPHRRGAEGLASELEALGYRAGRTYGRAEGTPTAALVDLLDRGPQLVVFVGHGSRFVWRIGPRPDIEKGWDALSLADLDRLEGRRGLPLVVALTCYANAFDHPFADSMGEKLLRLPRRGAIAAIAPSWRSDPPFAFAHAFVAALGAPAAPRLGDAYLTALRSGLDAVSVRTITLLGDPTLTFAQPGGEEWP